MKKRTVFAAILPCLLLAGCGTERSVFDVMSEQTTVYFYGQTEALECSVSVGQREGKYVVDGCHGQNVDFSLITLKISEAVDDKIDVVISVDGEESVIALELNPLNMTYMADLGYSLEGDDEVRVRYEVEEVILQNEGNNFAIDYKRAIEVGMEELGDEKENFFNSKTPKCEGYLRIVDGQKFGREGLYWCFNLIGEKLSSTNILISVNDEKIILRG